MTAHRLVLLRHGESEWNKLNLFTGWWDADLTELAIHYDLGEGHPLFGRRMPDLDLGTAAGRRHRQEGTPQVLPGQARQERQPLGSRLERPVSAYNQPTQIHGRHGRQHQHRGDQPGGGLHRATSPARPFVAISSS